MPDAVIVSAVRTPIGRAGKGALRTVRADVLREGHLRKERLVNRRYVHHRGYAPFSATMPASSR